MSRVYKKQHNTEKKKKKDTVCKITYKWKKCCENFLKYKKHSDTVVAIRSDKIMCTKKRYGSPEEKKTLFKNTL